MRNHVLSSIHVGAHGKEKGTYLRFERLCSRNFWHRQHERTFHQFSEQLKHCSYNFALLASFAAQNCHLLIIISAHNVSILICFIPLQPLDPV